MKVKDLLKSIDSWFCNSIYYCEFVTAVQESYNEQPNNLKYCYISDVTVNDENKTVDITLERDLGNTIFMYADKFRDMFIDTDLDYDITFWYEIEHYKTRIIEIDEVIHSTNGCLTIKFTERK
jgi:hypothetical protein